MNYLCGNVLHSRHISKPAKSEISEYLNPTGLPWYHYRRPFLIYGSHAHKLVTRIVNVDFTSIRIAHIYTAKRSSLNLSGFLGGGGECSTLYHPS